ncbi:FAD-dependent oxidoreductase [Mycolicibacterium llatzerense]|uniref:FAD-dependent oxidoreductase n=1 Tax=Mycolicibacterium llatzerense TaxID=280871 RepID=UPI0021B62CD4|nr:FAD-dependent oxidoreductase [Mycolicibacterium llatzerense]
MTVLIAGAGPTGLTAACGLLQRGVDVRIVDEADGPATTSRAIGVWSPTLGVLQRLGALGDLPDRILPVRRAVYRAGGKVHELDGLDELLPDGQPPIAMVSQVELEHRLRERLSQLGGAVEWSTAVTGGAGDTDGVAVQLNSSQSYEADWLIGCDGAHSQVRKIAGIPFSGSAVAERLLLADLHLDLPADREAVHVWLSRTATVAMFPLPGANDDLWRLVTEVPHDAEPPDIAEHFRHFLHTQAGDDVRLTGIDWTSRFVINQRVARTYRSGRILLAGDAAHVHSPLGGQGMNMGIADAENLAAKLALVATGQAPESLVDSYERERRPPARRVVAATGLATRVAFSRNPIVTWTRDNIAIPTGFTVARRRFVRRWAVQAVIRTQTALRSAPSPMS